MKRLYLVEKTTSTYVLAESAEEAEDKAERICQIDWPDEDFFATLVHGVPKCLELYGAYGDDEERTLRQILIDVRRDEAAEAEEEQRRRDWDAHPKLALGI